MSLGQIIWCEFELILVFMFIKLIRTIIPSSPISRLVFLLFPISLICILCMPEMGLCILSWCIDMFESGAYYKLAILLFIFGPYVLILVRNKFSASPIVRLVFILFPLICILSVLFSLFSWFYFFETPEFWAYYMLAILLFISGPFVLHSVRNKFSAVMGAFFYGFNWLLCVGVYDGIYGPCFTHFDFWVGLFLSVIFGYYIGHHNKAKTIAEETPGTTKTDGESESGQCCESLNQSRQDSNVQDTPSECSQPAEDVSRVQSGTNGGLCDCSMQNSRKSRRQCSCAQRRNWTNTSQEDAVPSTSLCIP